MLGDFKVPAGRPEHTVPGANAVTPVPAGPSGAGRLFHLGYDGHDLICESHAYRLCLDITTQNISAIADLALRLLHGSLPRFGRHR